MPEAVARMSQAAQEVPLRCPACTAPLPDPRACAGCGREYARVAGVPLLVPDRDPAAVDLRSEGGGLPAHDAAALSVPAVREAIERGDRVLELGAGRDITEQPGVVRTDAFLYGDGVLDFVADAHALPFADGAFDFVFSLAVFEHLPRPWLAAAEIARVLRPGGRAYTLCAFMQPLHGWPDHYFNMTESGLRELFADHLEIERAGPSRHCPDAESLVPLHIMRSLARNHLARGGRLPLKTRLRAYQLEWALTLAARRYGQLAPAMIAAPGGLPAWTPMAPAVELLGRRPG